ncbi:hypothetical protein IAR55_000858 [Kwoniella newhampshirensis]|uniref:Uncharacterized protein n=1 Tax=Kwoniella newhampshirensis TaxID=1651941 RepID=A0AAW0Z4C5_9TREE
MKTSTSFAILALLASASTSFAAPLPLPSNPDVDIKLDLDMNKGKKPTGAHMENGKMVGHEHEKNQKQGEKHHTRAEGSSDGLGREVSSLAQISARGILTREIFWAQQLVNGNSTPLQSGSAPSGGISRLSSVTKPITSTVSDTLDNGTLTPILGVTADDLLDRPTGVPASSKIGSNTSQLVNDTKFAPGSGSGPIINPSSTGGSTVPVLKDSERMVNNDAGSTLASVPEGQSLNSTEKSAQGLTANSKVVDTKSVDWTTSTIGKDTSGVDRTASSVTTGAASADKTAVPIAKDTDDGVNKSLTNDLVGKLVNSKDVSTATNGLGVDKTASGTISKDGAHVNTSDVGNTLKVSSTEDRVIKDVPGGGNNQPVPATLKAVNTGGTTKGTDSTKHSAEGSVAKDIDSAENTSGTGSTARPITSPAQKDIKNVDHTSSSVGKTSHSATYTNTDKTVDPVSAQVFPSGDNSQSSLLTVTNPNAQAKVLQTPGKADTLVDQDVNTNSAQNATGGLAPSSTSNNGHDKAAVGNNDNDVNVKVETPNRVKDGLVVDQSGQKVGPSDQRGNVVEEVVQGKILDKEFSKSSTAHSTTHHSSPPSASHSTSHSAPSASHSHGTTSTTPHPQVFAGYKSTTTAAAASVSSTHAASHSAHASVSTSGRGGTHSASATHADSKAAKSVVSAPALDIGLTSHDIDVKPHISSTPLTFLPVISSTLTLTHSSILPTITSSTKPKSKPKPEQARVAYGSKDQHIVSCDGLDHGDSDLIEECISGDLVDLKPKRTEVCPDDMQHDIHYLANADPIHADQSEQIAKYVRLCLAAGSL